MAVRGGAYFALNKAGIFQRSFLRLILWFMVLWSAGGSDALRSYVIEE